jgi:hypothetical protein
LAPFGQAVSEEKIFEKVYDIRRRQVMAKKGYSCKNYFLLSKNYKIYEGGKNDQHSKIYIPCNFEVNLITHLGVIALFS